MGTPGSLSTGGGRREPLVMATDLSGTRLDVT